MCWSLKHLSHRLLEEAETQVFSAKLYVEELASSIASVTVED